LFVTLTDYYGYRQLVQIHDPPLIHELEHHQVLRFTYRRRPNGEVESDFGLDNAAGLAFAARATSSFPGAFPPAQIAEMDDLILRRQASWPRRGQFIAGQFERHLQADVDPAKASFIDGAVLNNRPFQIAISAIHGRAAYRKVDRRLVYIEPHPASPVARVHLDAPGFFSTLRGAMSDIPSSQPVTDELSWILDFNECGDCGRSSTARDRMSARWSPRWSPRASSGRSRPTSCAPGASRSIPGSRAMPASPTRPMSGSSSPPCAHSAPN
jgi:patatin-related protein